MGKTGLQGDLDYMECEISNLREDLRGLRDKNHRLTQDNIKLTEYIRDLEMRAHSPSRVRHDSFSSQSKNTAHFLPTLQQNIVFY